MARIRTIKPAFFRHRDLFLLEQSSGYPVRVAFAGLWTASDREGRFRWRPEELKLDCLPYDPVDFVNVLEALVGAGFVRKYVVAGKDYGLIPSWTEHQSVPSREAQSALPAAPDHTGTVTAGSYLRGREGKGREGKGTEESPEALTRSEPAADGPRGIFESRDDDRADATTPILLAYPTVGTSGTAWRLRQAQVDEWQGAYPNLDVLGECRKALSWLNANPGRRKTARGMPKFLNGWLSRAVDSGRGSSPPANPLGPAVSDVDWFAECKAVHNGACGGDRMRHHHRTLIDAEKARAS